MYEIQCPQGHAIPVPASAAGSQVTCPECGSPQAVPKLGELRKFPRAATAIEPRKAAVTTGMAGRVVFALLMLVAVGLLAGTSFASFRWLSLPKPPDSQTHIQADQAEIAQLTPIEMLAVWEEYERFDSSVPRPFDYQQMQNLRDHWKGIAMVTGGLCLACILLAVLAAVISRQKKPAGHLGS